MHFQISGNHFTAMDDLPDIPRFPSEETDSEVPPDSDTQLVEEREKRERKKKKVTLKVVRIL